MVFNSLNIYKRNYGFRYSAGERFTPAMYGELIDYLREVATDYPATHTIFAGDLNGHLFDDVRKISAFDVALRVMDQELAADGFTRFPTVCSYITNLVILLHIPLVSAD